MSTRLACLMTFAATLTLSCAHVGPVIDAGKVCATEAGKATVDEILPKANEILGCSIADTSAIPQCAVDGLEGLAVDYTKDFVICALEKIAAGKFATPGDSAAAVRQRRAKAYLDAHKPVAGLCLGHCGPSRSCG
jgi:hypothetical protein